MALHLKTRYGKIWMDVNKKFAMEHSKLLFEKEFINIIEREYYDIFVDVGAGWGYFSVPASFYAKVVFAFEPFEIRRNLLLKNVRELNRENIIVKNEAVGTGNKKLYIGGHMIGPHSGVRQERIEVKWNSIKNILRNSEDTATVIKVDVEGNELDVVKSAGNLENYKNITWLIERHQRKNYGYSEEVLFEAMKPLKGELVGSRAWTYHYVFRR